MQNLLFRYSKFIKSNRQKTFHDGKEIFYANEVELMLSVALEDRWINILDKKPPKHDLVIFKTKTGIEISRLDNSGYTSVDVKDIIAWLPIPKS